jgi:hypothetical protein
MFYAIYCGRYVWALFKVAFAKLSFETREPGSCTRTSGEHVGKANGNRRIDSFVFVLILATRRL